MAAQDTATTDERDLIWNPPHGHDGGQLFKAVQNGNVNVSALNVYTHDGPGDHEVIKAIEVEWTNGQTHKYGHASGPSTSTTFHKSERITKFIIYGGDWVDAIYYESTRLPGGWKAGGSGGIPAEQDIGNGVFVGLWGNAGFDIDSLGGVFESSKDKADK
ncbi:unnamed protein product [Clonostachys byssicola]|uniref:Mannose-binding lectin n=1 Tax=Clonostachys byssicola TaxID=160290 RepID=A0A9N9Y7L3_9HYPO|nr:unnamed protein product [Clonostachys byssicola]